jgi:hypothetical protein
MLFYPSLLVAYAPPKPNLFTMQVWTAASTADAAWHSFLGRPFVGLAPTANYAEPFDAQVRCSDEYPIYI